MDIEAAIEMNEWQRPCNRDMAFRDLTCMLRGTTKSGKQIPIALYARAIVNGPEMHQFETLAPAREQQARVSLRSAIAELTERRRGFPGMRGYFRITKVEPWN